MTDHSEKRHVVEWTSTDAVEKRGLKDIGGWGGVIEKGHRWANFISAIDPAVVAHFEALREAILARGLRRGGDWHQNAADGVPVFDDGCTATFSFRAWGDLMAAIWAGEDGRDYEYMDFYMDCCVEDAGVRLSPPLTD